MSIEIKPFGKLNSGEEVTAYTLTNSNNYFKFRWNITIYKNAWKRRKSSRYSLWI